MNTGELAKLRGEWHSIREGTLFAALLDEVRKRRDAVAETVLRCKNTRDEDMQIKGEVRGLNLALTVMDNYIKQKVGDKNGIG